MEIFVILLSIIFVLFYLFRPKTKKEEENFNAKDNWRGGF